MGCAKVEVWNEQEARCGEAALLEENHREGGAEWDVDSGVLPRASAEGESVLLVAAQTERGWGERKVASGVGRRASFALVSDGAGVMSTGLELVLRDGRRLRISQGVEEESLRAVLAALES
jgi:hypothetical protein